MRRVESTDGTRSWNRLIAFFSDGCDRVFQDHFIVLTFVLFDELLVDGSDGVGGIAVADDFETQVRDDGRVPDNVRLWFVEFVGIGADGADVVLDGGQAPIKSVVQSRLHRRQIHRRIFNYKYVKRVGLKVDGRSERFGSCQVHDFADSGRDAVALKVHVTYWWPVHDLRFV